MLSGLLRSESAIQANILIMRAFVAMWKFSSTLVTVPTLPANAVRTASFLHAININLKILIFLNQ